MTQKLKGTTIIMTRGDTLKVTINLLKDDGTPYVPQTGDIIRFAAKENYSDDSTVINKVIPNDTMLLQLDPSDTKRLAFGDYVYDVQITFANGDVDTFIEKAKLRLTEEVA